MNLNGIGIASDTIATNRSDSGDKTTPNAEKIYELGPKHLVVALHYGSTGLNDLHHQFHFNRWVETLDEPFATLKEYVDDYMRFGAEGPKMHSPESELVEIRYLLRDHYQHLRKRILDEAPTFADDDPRTEVEQGQIFADLEKRILGEGLVHLQSLKPFDGVDEAWVKAIFKKLGFKPKDVWEDVFEGFHIDETLARGLNKQAPLVLSRFQPMPWDSSLAFVGYGRDEPFASNIALTCRSLLGDRFLASPEDPTEVGPGAAQSEISRFAQGDAIESFLYGFNSDIRGGFHAAIGHHVAESMGEEPDWDVVNRIQTAVMDYVSGHSWRTYVQPILRRVAGMNNRDLAELAETLVKIQATSSQATDGPASVGGLIEVLTIDRIGGVKWQTRLPR